MNKNMKKYITPILLILIGLATLSFTADTGVTLKLKPETGKTYTITSKSVSTNTVGDPDFSLSSSQIMTVRQSFTAKDVTGNQVVVSSQIDAIKLSMSLMGMDIDYDSEHPTEANPLIEDQIKAYSKSLKKPFSITFDAKGNMINGKNELSMSQLSGAIVPLPKEELKVGSKWSSQNKQDISGTRLTVKMDYTVTAISATSVDLSFIGTVKAKDTSGSLSGTANINPQTGMITKSTTKANISMTIREQGWSTPATIKATTDIEVK